VQGAFVGLLVGLLDCWIVGWIVCFDSHGVDSRGVDPNRFDREFADTIAEKEMHSSERNSSHRIASQPNEWNEWDEIMKRDKTIESRRNENQQQML